MFKGKANDWNYDLQAPTALCLLSKQVLCQQQ